jgi:hypothetical protein
LKRGFTAEAFFQCLEEYTELGVLQVDQVTCADACSSSTCAEHVRITSSPFWLGGPFHRWCSCISFVSPCCYVTMNSRRARGLCSWGDLKRETHTAGIWLQLLVPDGSCFYFFFVVMHTDMSTKHHKPSVYLLPGEWANQGDWGIRL